MTGQVFADWLARGRIHQQEGRPADAVPCFRRAASEDPQSPLPHFHLGEVWWQLGKAAAAQGAWQRSAALDASFIAPRLALAESALMRSDASGARVAAEEAAMLDPRNARAQATATIINAANGDRNAFARIAAILAADASLAEPAPIGSALAAAMEKLEDDVHARAAIIAVLLPHAARLAPALLAVLAEAGATLPAGVAERAWTIADAEPLRRLAIALHPRHPDLAARLATAYSALNAALPAPPVPLVWPQRTTGNALRIVWVCPVPHGPTWNAWHDAMIHAVGDDPNGFSHVLLCAGDGAATRAALRATPLGAAIAIELAAIPDMTTARLVATRDGDVIIDAVGLAAATAAMLAARPARRLWSLAAGAPAHREPLVERVLEGPDDLRGALLALRTGVGAEAVSTLSADALARLWNDAVRQHREGDLAAANAGYEAVAQAQPLFAPAKHLLGVLAAAAGEHERARAMFDAAIAAAPGFVEARLAGAEFALAQHRPEYAVQLARDGLARTPHDVALWRTLGLAELARRDGAAAEQALANALRLAPTDAMLHFNHGVALQMRADAPAAARAYQRALTFDPDMVEADFNLGVLFQQQDNHAAAIAAYGNVLAVDARHIAAYKNLGEALFAAGRFDAWRANFRRFEANCPDALPLAVQALEVCQYDGDFASVERYLEGLRQEKFRARDENELVDCLEQLLYLLLFFDVEPGMLFRFAQTYDAAATRIHGGPMARPEPRRPGPLRIGYLSGDLRNHVMGKMIWQAIEHHDRARFELYFYSTSPVRDAWTERFEGCAHTFESVAPLDDARAAERIAQDDLDLLVDLSTHTRGARPGILARKPARVQLTHVASAGTVGLSAIDCKITDHFADVPENQATQIERLLPMDGCVFPFRHVAPAATHPFHRAALGIAADRVVIGAFVNPLKLSRRCLTLWRDVLARIPRAVLAFSPANPAFRDAYVKLAAAMGIAPDRLLFLPQGRDDAENQARYNVVDFVLDTMPFGGVNGTIEALDMGVPVITLAGKRHGERTSYSILANLGVPQTIATTGRDYVEVAVRLADDANFRHEVTAAIAAGLAESPLVNMKQHTRHLESAYRTAITAQAAPAAD